MINNFLYWLFSTLELAITKIITSKYKIDNIIFNSTFKSLTLPYYIYKIFKFKSENNNLIPGAQWFDIFCGILNQLDIILSYIALANLFIGEYFTYRTLSVFFGEIYLTIYYKKISPLYKIFSMILILAASINLLYFTSSGNLLYSFICIISSIIHSLLSFVIEVNVKNNNERRLNFYWSKTISYIIALFMGLISEYSYGVIKHILSAFDINNILIIVALELIICILENFNYYYRIKVVYQYEQNGSIVVQFIDIIRRVTLIGVGVAIFKENYTFIFYISLSLMFLGSLIGLTNIKKIINFCKKKFIISKNNTNNNTFTDI